MVFCHTFLTCHIGYLIVFASCPPCLITCVDNREPPSDCVYYCYYIRNIPPFMVSYSKHITIYMIFLIIICGLIFFDVRECNRSKMSSILSLYAIARSTMTTAVPIGPITSPGIGEITTCSTWRHKKPRKERGPSELRKAVICSLLRKKEIRPVLYRMKVEPVTIETRIANRSHVLFWNIPMSILLLHYGDIQTTLTFRFYQFKAFAEVLQSWCRPKLY
jgi:hypothetical protein